MRAIPLILLALSVLLLLGNAYAFPSISAIMSSVKPVSYTLPISIDYSASSIDMAIPGFDKFEVNSIIDRQLSEGKIPKVPAGNDGGNSPSDGTDTSNGGNQIDNGNTDGSNGQSGTGGSGDNSGGSSDGNNGSNNNGGNSGGSSGGSSTPGIKVITIEASSTIQSSDENAYGQEIAAENSIIGEI